MNITDWPNFKTRLINEDCSINIFGCDTNGVFYLLPHYKSIQEVTEDLASKFKTLYANFEIFKKFYDVDDLYSVALIHNLNSNIIRSLPKSCGPPSTTSTWNSKELTQPTSELHLRSSSPPGTLTNWREITKPIPHFSMSTSCPYHGN